MKQRIQFGEAESFVAGIRNGGRGTRSHFIAPGFGTRCICCNVEAHGRTRDFDPSTDKIRADVVPMPVCAPCHDHAFVQPTTAIFQLGLLMVSAILGGMCVYYLGIRPHDDVLKIGIAISAAAFVLDLMWVLQVRRRVALAREEGHHPDLGFSVSHGRTWLDTTNPELVEDLLARNPSARVLPTPLLWRRANRRERPNARVVKRR